MKLKDINNRYQVRFKTCNQVYHLLYDQIRYYILNQIKSQVDNKVWDQVEDQIWNQVYNFGEVYNEDRI
jgi:hypothetical protein